MKRLRSGRKIDISYEAVCHRRNGGRFYGFMSGEEETISKCADAAV